MQLLKLKLPPESLESCNSWNVFAFPFTFTIFFSNVLLNNKESTKKVFWYASQLSFETVIRFTFQLKRLLALIFYYMKCPKFKTNIFTFMLLIVVALNFKLPPKPLESSASWNVFAFPFTFTIFFLMFCWIMKKDFFFDML